MTFGHDSGAVALKAPRATLRPDQVE
jgi:hypothetical protein